MSPNPSFSNTTAQSPWSPDRPYVELPQLPPSRDLETKAILKQCITARAALAELKQAADLIPNPAVLINTIPLLEAKDSSEIENIVTTTDRLFRHADSHDSQADPATKEALRCRTALHQGFRSLEDRPLCIRTAVEICTTIKGVEMDIRCTPGTQLVSDRNGESIYTPPEGEALLRKLLANWERFLQDERELDPLIRMAVGHYQFEAIHPFTDGNGRTGRVINILLLIQEKLLTLPVLYLSRYIIAHKTDYYRLLQKVTSEQAWEEWVLYMLRAVEETALWTTGKIAAIRSLAEHTTEHVRERLPKIYSRELVETIFEQPYCRIGNLVDKQIAQRQAASRYLKDLVGARVLSEIQAGKEKLFTHPKLIQLLMRDGNDFAPYAGAT
ncbi:MULTISPECIES: Fic family protein [unclassified Variovorax]|uniref:protein adenylyltransferase Fic n=1 Tax=unclassified Variovorax TaxID=663243 RepID=UPI0008396568|nr:MULTISPECIES: Fic family protein [unclassified Variovorax]PNG59268.1 Adenosine monophosphate-protein transferase SoFic [Variovorax sp. B4]PNG60941.1 Adenosine monophosphate-protein transferase SoFic [Variovorax sp. B2]VTV13128.1 Adenosine monophosphate-protein transferase SoFic [Variovorax sp. WDL1]